VAAYSPFATHAFITEGALTDPLTGLRLADVLPCDPFQVPSGVGVWQTAVGYASLTIRLRDETVVTTTTRTTYLADGRQTVTTTTQESQTVAHLPVVVMRGQGVGAVLGPAQARLLGVDTSGWQEEAELDPLAQLRRECLEVSSTWLAGMRGGVGGRGGARGHILFLSYISDRG
jgi:hypothetical protein